MSQQQLVFSQTLTPDERKRNGRTRVMDLTIAQLRRAYEHDAPFNSEATYRVTLEKIVAEQHQ